MSNLEDAIANVRADALAALDGRIAPLELLRNKKLFITGGTGFLGAWLLELLSVLNSDFGFETRVSVYSRNCQVFAERWPHLGFHKWIHFEEGDIRYISELPRDTNFVIHAAGLTDRLNFSTQPTAVAEVNCFGTARLLKACLLLEELEKFTLLSSGLIYGGQAWERPRISESYCGPLRLDSAATVYAESKRMAEVFAQAAISESKLPLVVLRPFAFVGPYQSLQLPWAVTDFIRDSMQGGPIRIMGDGLTVRSIMYASDFAYAVLAATVKAPSRSVFNLGSTEPVELIDLARKITRFFSPTPKIQTQVGQVEHHRNRLVPDISAIERVIGPIQTVPLEIALQKSIQWHSLMHPV